MNKTNTPLVVDSISKVKESNDNDYHYNNHNPAGKKRLQFCQGISAREFIAEQRKNDKYLKNLLDFLKTITSHAC